MDKINHTPKTGIARARRRTLAVSCGGTLGLVVLISGLYLTWANHLPALPREPPVPVPNGLDVLYTAAGQLRSDRGFYEQPSDPRALRGALHAEHSTLDALRKGLRLPCAVPGDPGGYFPSLARLRDAARHFQAEAKLQRADGRDADAVSCGLDALELGARLTHGAATPALSGIACSIMGREVAAASVIRLGASDARRLGRRVDMVISEYASPEEIAEASRREDLRMYRAALLGYPAWSEFNTGSLSDRVKATRDLCQRLVYPNPVAYASYERFLDAVVHELGKPYPVRHIPAAPTRGPLGDVLKDEGELWERLSWMFTRESALLRLFRLRLALQEYRVETGRYPDSLGQPSSRLPTSDLVDPFTEKPLRYRREGTGYCVYSVGPDGVDDGGRSIAKGGWAAVVPKGDIVARVVGIR